MLLDKKSLFLILVKKYSQSFPIVCSLNSILIWLKILKYSNQNIQEMYSKYIFNKTTKVEKSRTTLFTLSMLTPLLMLGLQKTH